MAGPHLLAYPSRHTRYLLLDLVTRRSCYMRVRLGPMGRFGVRYPGWPRVVGQVDRPHLLRLWLPIFDALAICPNAAYFVKGGIVADADARR